MKNGPIIFRLVSGESVIGTLISENEKEYVVNRPYSINAFMMGETPMNSKEIVFLRDWLKFSIDLSTNIEKKSVLHTSVADPKITEMYKRKMNDDDVPGPLSSEIEDMISNIVKVIEESTLSDLLEDVKNQNEGMDENEIVEKLYKLQMPITEAFLNDLINLISEHSEDLDVDINGNFDDWNFEDEEPEKFDDPEEYGNHFRHWPIDPKDYF